MRVRLNKPLAGIAGGVRLSQFLPGVIYEVSDSVGAELASVGAEVLPPQLPGVPPAGTAPLSEEQLTGGVTVIQQDRAADREPRRKPDTSS